jgi:hypothetical protein
MTGAGSRSRVLHSRKGVVLVRLKLDYPPASLRAASSATAAAPFPIRILIDWRRPYPAIDASGDAWADRACLTRDKRLRLTDSFADAGSPLLFVFLDMPAARRGFGRRDHSNNRQRSCVHGQCKKPYRKFAHARLPLRRNTRKIGFELLALIDCSEKARTQIQDIRCHKQPGRNYSAANLCDRHEQFTDLNS